MVALRPATHPRFPQKLGFLEIPKARLFLSSYGIAIHVGNLGADDKYGL